MTTGTAPPLLQQKHIIPLLMILGDRNHSFNELQRELSMSPSTLSRRLKDLRKRGVLESVVVDEGRISSKYKLTEKGKRVLEKAKEINSIHDQVDNIVSIQ
jgi:DNA-binding HxlR family transcriptional regulator